MGIYKLYSKRNKLTPEIFTYDELPQKFKVQIIRIWYKYYEIGGKRYIQYFEKVREILCDEYGKFQLFNSDYDLDAYQEVCAFFENSKVIDEGLDVIELVFNVAISEISELINNSIPQLKLSESINFLNIRFLENGIGYEFRNGEIIRIDNSLLHKEVIIPTIYFLSSPDFKNANEEYLSAHEHFRHNRTKECLNESLKALETTLKIICHQNGWISEKGETAKALLDLCFQNNLIPPYLANHFGGLRASLESGVPTLRNKLGGHGQGVQAIEVPMHFASYMLYLTGTTINFLVSCQEELKP